MEEQRHGDPEDVPRGFVNAWNRRNAAELADWFEEDADFVNVVGLWWQDRASIERAHDYGLTHIFNQSRLHLIRLKTRRFAEDLAIVHARMRLRGQTPTQDVPEPRPRTNVFTFVVRRRNDRWRCVAAHNTDVVPGAETNIMTAGALRPTRYR